MRSPLDRVAGYVDDLLRERKPRRFPAEPDDAAALYAAAALKAARPGADLPAPGFVRGLEARLAPGVAQQPARGSTGPPRLSRRTALQLGSAAAAAAVAGVAIDRAVNRDAAPPPDTLQVAGRWVPVVTLAALEVGRAVRFSTPGVEGFVVNHGGRPLAMSAVCTHMGCILHFNPAQSRLDCPCHGASFALDGSPISREYLRSLPRLNARVRGGSVEVEVPAQA